MSVFNKLSRLCRPIDGPDDDQLLALERRAGLMTAWYDQRGVNDAMPPEQPQVGYANDHLRMVDPDWNPR